MLSAKKDLKGERILITTGATREEIDPVRFISNHSSGKMGFALAQAAQSRGADVTLVAGATSVHPPSSIRLIRAISAEEMFNAVMNEISNATVYIGAAAIADYRPASRAENKIKKTEDELTIVLEKTKDILAEVGKTKHDGLLVIGFAAETNDVVAYAKSKLEKKNLDAIVANDITKSGAGFNADTNIITIITHDKEPTALPMMTKSEAAHRVLDEIVRLRKQP
jgi:phosphopantothenoylcysteine decarboxylase/phosphopantothenate--cysteine ligase